MLQIQSPFQQLFDTNGSPLDDGYVYIGTANANPETSPIAIYWDDAGTIPAAQPLRTLNGYLVRSGTPARVYTALEDFSMTVKDRQGRVVFSVLDATSDSNLTNALASSSGSSLVGFLQSGANAQPRTVQSKLRDVVSVKDFGAVGDGVADDTNAFNNALAAAKSVYVPDGTYRVAISLTGAAMANRTIVGASKIGVTLIPISNSAHVISVTSSANYPTIKNLNIVNNGVGNNGSHYGIYMNAISGAVIEDVNVDGFNNNIHIIEQNDFVYSKVRCTNAVFSTGITGCGIFASGTGAAGPECYMDTLYMIAGKYGIYLDAIESPAISNSTCVLQSDTGFYCTNTVPAYSTGPFLSNCLFDSSSVNAIYLNKQINSMLRGVWLSGSLSTSKGLVLNDCLKGCYDIQAYGCKGTALYLTSNSRQNTFTGVVSNNNADGIVVDSGSYGNTFSGIVIHANTGRGYNLLDTTAAEPNMLVGCYVAGNGTANVMQSKDIRTGGNYGEGQSYSASFSLSGVTAGTAPRLLAGGASGVVDFTVPYTGSITSLSTVINTTIATGSFNLYVQKNRTNTSLLCNMTTAKNSSGLSGGDICRDRSVVLPGAIPVTAGDVISVYLDATGGTFTSSPASFSAVVTILAQ